MKEAVKLDIWYIFSVVAYNGHQIIMVARLVYFVLVMSMRVGLPSILWRRGCHML